eukprot:5385923-Prymnesium_polylepis.1
MADLWRSAWRTSAWRNFELRACTLLVASDQLFITSTALSRMRGIRAYTMYGGRRAASEGGAPSV